MSDLIDRQAAIEALFDMQGKYDEEGYGWIIRTDACRRIDALPSAQPEQRWIPVTERLPKIGEKVLVSTKYTVFTQVFKRIYGTPDRWGWEHNTIKKVTAWMPLLPLWKGDKETDE